jgi:hypothetical protein
MFTAKRKKKHANTICGESAEFYITEGGTYGSYWALKRQHVYNTDLPFHYRHIQHNKIIAILPVIVML